MSSVVPPGSADEALEMLTAAMGYLAAADATALTAQEQERCLRVLERSTAVGTAARTSVLSAFTAAQGYSADAQSVQGNRVDLSSTPRWISRIPLLGRCPGARRSVAFRT